MMKLSLVTDVLKDLSYTEMLDTVQKKYGLNAVEISAGGWQPTPHIDREALLKDNGKVKAFKKELEARGMELAALNCSGNPLAPGELGELHTKTIRETILLAEKLGVKKIVTMSGLPAGGPHDTIPNWICSTISWPDYMPEALRYQWEDVAIPWWKDTGKLAKEHGVEKIALEAFPSQLVYNPRTLLKLRRAAGDTIGINLDPSHFFVMGIDPISTIRDLKGAIYHVHGKDARIEKDLAKVNGLMETKPVTDSYNRTWNYVGVGCGHDLQYWREFFSVLGMAGYNNDFVSLEMEDLTMSVDAGLRTSIDTLKNSIIK
ncbi:sugar phosphate isomerase/epimerase [Secundilactobacillus sp. HBUAS58055]|nr:sugar phosphate isomerase/epimerase [Secundilactobacillus angelensis]MCH5461748.1 sugar phosphate isomerase/epimerase [Secundilactobacillus angelensis]